MKQVIVTILFFCSIGCTNKEKKYSGILDREKMQAVLWDIIEADVFTEQFIKKDSLKNAAVENAQLQNKIFSIHQVSKADFYKSYEYYLLHTSEMRILLDSMTTKAERDRTKMFERHVGGNK